MSKGMHTVLGPEARFEGSLDFEGDVRIDGYFRGDIVSRDRLIVGEGARIEGTVRVGTLILNGTIEGVVIASQGAELESPGRLVGELHTPSLQVARGVVLDGTVHMMDGGVELAVVPEEPVEAQSPLISG